MKSISIKGKPYIMVNERLKEFRENEKYKGWSLTSEIVSLTENSCVIKAIVCDESGIVKATGMAQEDKQSSAINKTSYVENCETSAWGRALGNLGIGIDESIASAEEVTIAIAKQINQPAIDESKIVNSKEQVQEKVAVNTNVNVNTKSFLLGGDYVLTFGKYKDKTLRYIYEEIADYEYMNWLKENASEEVYDNIIKYKEELKGN